MIGLDTNVLVRYLTQDDETQFKIAAKLIESAKAGGLYVSDVVLCELVWVMEDCYGHARKEVAKLLENVLLTRVFVFQSQAELWSALADFRTGKGDFSDYLIGPNSHDGQDAPKPQHSTAP